MKKINLLAFLIIFGALLQSAHLLAQINQMPFGKNRVQFHRFFDEWSQYESENFVTYWYGQGRFIGQAAAQIAEFDFDEIQKILEYRLNDKMEIIVYTDLTDLHQSNIGTEETFVTSSNQVKVIGEKIFVYFDGDHTHLRRQLREGIAAVFLNAMLFGSNLQEVVQNAISLNLPEWFKQGLVSYIAEEWNSSMDDRLRDIFQKKQYKNYNKFAQNEPRLAGHAFWYYIAHQFGKANVSNLLYLTRINRSLEDAMMYVMGNGYQAMSLACMDFYKKRYDKELADATDVHKLSQVKFKNKFKLPLHEPRLSPDGKQVAYVFNEIGKWTIYIQDLKTQKRTVLLRGGTRNPFQATDYNYPLIAWNPDNQRIHIVYEKRDVIKILEYNLTDKKKKIEDFQPEFQRVYSIDFMNPRDMVVSGGQRGFSDLFLYNLVNRSFKRVTNDFWDDLDAKYAVLGGRKGILFSSNRATEKLATEKLDSTLPVNNFDLFFLNFDDTSNTLVRVVQTPDANEHQPAVIDSTYFSYLSDESGVANRQVAYLKDVLVRVDTIFYHTNAFKEVVPLYVMQDSARLFSDSLKIDSTVLKEITKTVAVAHNNTNYNRNIVAQHTAPRVKKFVEVFYTERLPRMHIGTLTPDSVKTPNFTRFWEWKKKKVLGSNKQNKGKKTERIPAQPQQPDSEQPLKPVEKPKTDTVKKVDIDNYIFQSEFDTDEKPVTTQITKEEVKKAEPTEGVVQPEIEPTREAIFNILMGDRVTSDDKKIHIFKQNRIIPYRLKFKTDYFNTKLDNNLLFEGLDSYAGTPQGFTTPPVGILMKGNFKDLLEDYQLEGGVRIPTTFNGYEAYAFFDDRKRQLDRRYAIYHRSTRFSDNTNSRVDTRRSRSQTTLGQYEVRYPLSMFARLQATGTLRFDRFTQLATDRATLDSPTINEQRMGIKVQYVFDNTLDIDVNVKNGTRYKVWVDFVKGFNMNFEERFDFEFKSGFMGVFGFDFRHYERVLKHSVLALRGAGATTFGRERLLYFLGGVDNEIFANFGEDVTVPPGTYAFQTLAANMRGFSRNIRNGTSNALINVEFRIPIFKYLSSKPITSSFWRNFQLVGFFDAGTAWHGVNPFKRDNPLNTIFLPKDNPNSPVQIKVNYFKDPVVASYGAGLRIMLFGYMLRADYGWGIETRQVQKPVLHISLGTDF